MEIKTSFEINEHLNSIPEDVKYNENGDWTQFTNDCQNKKWVAVDDMKRLINKIGGLTVSKPERFDSETVIRINTICNNALKEISFNY